MCSFPPEIPSLAGLATSCRAARPGPCTTMSRPIGGERFVGCVGPVHSVARAYLSASSVFAPSVSEWPARSCSQTPCSLLEGACSGTLQRVTTGGGVTCDSGARDPRWRQQRCGHAHELEVGAQAAIDEHVRTRRDGNAANRAAFAVVSACALHWGRGAVIEPRPWMPKRGRGPPCVPTNAVGTRKRRWQRQAERAGTEGWLLRPTPWVRDQAGLALGATLPPVPAVRTVKHTEARHFGGHHKLGHAGAVHVAQGNHSAARASCHGTVAVHRAARNPSHVRSRRDSHPLWVLTAATGSDMASSQTSCFSSAGLGPSAPRATSTVSAPDRLGPTPRTVAAELGGAVAVRRRRFARVQAPLLLRGARLLRRRRGRPALELGH